MTEPNHIPKLDTPGVLAKRLKQPLHRVLYVLRTRKGIRPAARAGRLRLYDQAAIRALVAELAAIDRRQGRRGCSGGQR